MSLRIVVVGAGAMGSIFGAALQESGNDVSFVDANAEVARVINSSGLVIEDRDGGTKTHRIPASTDGALAQGVADLVLFLVKGFATAPAAELVGAMVGPTTIILTLQNGLGNADLLRQRFPANPLVVGNSLHSAAMIRPGVVQHTGVRETYVGPASDDWRPAAERTAAAFAGSRFEVHALGASEIREQIWSKFVLNCGSLPTLALTGLSTDEAAHHEGVMRLIDEVVRETCAIARAEAVELDQEERVTFSRDLISRAGGKASMLQDVEGKRRTEIDTINGAAILFARKHGLPAPLNHAMFALVKGREAAMGILS